MSNDKTNLTQGNIKSTLTRLTIPMIFGVFGIIFFNLVDAFFVLKLGTKQFAALTLTFPVVLIVNSITLGMGMGSTIIVSKSIGEKNHDKVKRFATDSLLLTIIIVLFFNIIGFLTIEPLFKFLGADDNTLPYIKEYMQIWYLGMVFLVVPMVGNSIIRGLGDTKTPGYVMFISGIVNAILDPLFIFGIGFLPRLEVQGAAIATVIARAISFIVAMYILLYKRKVITFTKVQFSKIIESWKKIAYIGIPNIVTRVIDPLTAGFVTKMVAQYDNTTIAGYGLVTRIDQFALLVIISLSTIISPFIGQNLGAKKIERVRQSLILSYKFSLLYGLFIFIINIFFSKKLLSLFNIESGVLNMAVIFLMILTFSYGLRGILLISCSALNTLGKPYLSSGLMLVQILLIFIPSSMIISKFIGVNGIFIGFSLSYIVIGFISYLFIRKTVLHVDFKPIQNV